MEEWNKKMTERKYHKSDIGYEEDIIKRGATNICYEQEQFEEKIELRKTFCEPEALL